MNVEQRLTKARTYLLLDHPWYGSLCLRLKFEKMDSGTASTDGTKFFYCEEWVNQQTDAKLIGVMAHETMHCALLHMFRGKGRNWDLWNQACDYAINPIIKREGLELPEDVLLDFKFEGMSAEQIYAYLEANPDEQPQSGAGKGTGDFQPAPEGQPEPGEGEAQQESDWQVAAEQASAAAKKQGQLSSDIDRLLKAGRESQTDWRTILHRFIEQTQPSDYSWVKPNRRYVAQGLYLPGIERENLPKIGIAVDTSGSIGADMLKEFGQELTAILHEARPESIEVVYCDSSVKGHESFSPDDPEVVLHAKGGGGTRFQPAIDYFKEDPPVCMIYLTDLEGPKPEEPNFPVLWAVPEWQTAQGWFGTTVRLIKERNA